MGFLAFLRFLVAMAAAFFASMSISIVAMGSILDINSIEIHEVAFEKENFDTLSYQ